MVAAVSLLEETKGKLRTEAHRTAVPYDRTRTTPTRPHMFPIALHVHGAMYTVKRSHRDPPTQTDHERFLRYSSTA